MKDIEATPLNIKELLGDKKYTLSYFQREYNWRKGHIEDLINDLTGEFFLYEENSNSENGNDNYPFYFLGSIIVSEENGSLSLIDGQQRLTSLCLILIYIANTYPEISSEILPLVYKEDTHKVRTYTIHAPDRTKIMNSLCDGEGINVGDSIISVRNIKKCYEHVENILSKLNLSNEKMSSFITWLKANVYIAEIRAYSSEDGYKIFESANDRGLNLSPVDMLKSYLLSKIEGEKEQKRLDDLWKKQIDKIANAKETDSDAIKCWLRATCANGVNDFDNIGSEFHRWIRDKVKHKSIKLETSGDFSEFIDRQFGFYTNSYISLKINSKSYSVENENIFCNQYNQFSLQYPVILSAINCDDTDDMKFKKINLLSTFIDIFIARHLWSGNSAAIAQNRVKFPMSEIITQIRNKKLEYIADYLLERLDDCPDFRPYGTPSNGKVARQFLARFSAWLDNKMDISDNNLPNYLDVKTCNIEHVMPDKYDEQYKDIKDDTTDKREFEDEQDFQYTRNKIGALVLLPASSNKSFNDLPYEDKVKHYLKQNMILAKTLNKEFYDRTPEFNRVMNDNNIPFQSHDKFLKDEVEKRIRVYTRLAKIIWSPERIKEIADS